MSAATTPPSGGGKTDLLMRFFESEFFDSWICLTYLYKSQSQGVLDYLCNRLYTLPEKDAEKYLSQLCHFVYARPSSSLERVLVDLCAQSLRIAVKTYWLLLAISQDQPRNKHIASLRDKCEQAALEGYWDLPFKETKLPPISPLHQRPGHLFNQLLSPSSKNGQHPLKADRFGSPDPFRFGRSRPMSPDPVRPMSPDGLGGGLYSSVFVDTGVEGLLQPSPVNLRQIRQHVVSPKSSESNLPSLQTPSRRADNEQMKSLRIELGSGGSSGLVLSDDAEIASPPFSPPNSPRRRQTTFGATLDFIEALCTASGGLTAFQPEDRDWALHKVLQNINIQVEKASKKGVAIWFPMGDTNLRVVRLAARESTLLNSREKAPFTLHVEVLDEELRTVEESIAADLAASTDILSDSTLFRLSTQDASGSAETNGQGINLLMVEEERFTDTEAKQHVAKQPGSLTLQAPGCLLQQQQKQQSTSHASGLDDKEHACNPSSATASRQAERCANGRVHHFRSPSLETTSSSVAAAALAAVRGSSAGDKPAVMQDMVVCDSSSPSTVSGASLRSIGESPNTSSPMSSPSDPAAAPQQEGSMQRQQQDNHSKMERTPVNNSDLSTKRSHSSSQSGWSSPTLAPDISASDFTFEQSPPRPRSLNVDLEAVSNSKAHAGLPGGDPTALPFSMPKVAGGGTWIGGSFKHGGAYHAQPSTSAPATLVSGLSTALAGLRGEAPLVLVNFDILNDMSSTASSFSESASGLSSQHVEATKATTGSIAERSESNEEINNSSVGRGSFSRSETQQPLWWHDNVQAGAGLVSSSTSVRQCSKSGWACKLGLCKLCSGKILNSTAEVVQPQPYVKVKFVVQGGVDLTIKRTPPRHQRVPSHEAILKVAKQHKVPIPPNTLPPSLPPSSRQQQQEARPIPPPVASVCVKADASMKQPVPLAEQQAKTSILGSPASKILRKSAAAFKPSAFGKAQQQQQQTAGTAAVPSSSTTGQEVPRPVQTDASGSTRKSPETQSLILGQLGHDQATLQRQEAAEAIYGERWTVKRTRVQQETPHGRRPGWDLRCVIVKSGDDCRQELLAMQLIQAFFDIFQEAQLPLWLRPYEVLVTSNRTALIEMVPNAPSIHSIKAKSAPNTSLREHFEAKYIHGTPAFAKAQRNFVESLAAYSLVCYLLQIRDRHNGNILLDDAGHIIHIDFGFMLSNSPGGVNFESAPFKLTRELLEVMDSNSDGKPSELFDYFKVLMIQGFLAVRKHADRITLLVEMMSGSGCPCFKSKVAAVQGLKKRLNLNMPEHQVVEAVLGLISDSLDSWRTRQYDYYQRVLNGIL